jgi:glycosyltransferase involved in cell wall biosynthesis
MNILFIASWFPDDENKYTGIFVKRHLLAILKFCNPFVISFHTTKFKNRIDYTEKEGFKHLKLYIKKKYFKKGFFLKRYFIGIYFFIKFILIAVRIIRKKIKRVDLIHLNVMFPMGVIALFFSLLYKAPIIWVEHSGPFKMQVNNIIKKLLIRLICKKIKYILPVSRNLMKEMRNYGIKGKFKLIVNIVDTNLFKHVKIFKRRFKKVISHVSFLDDTVKRVSGIIKAAWILSYKRKDFKIKIVGDGKDKFKLENLSKELGVYNKIVFFLGAMSPKKVAKILQNSDFFVFNSVRENLPVATLEALSCGLPVICTKCGEPVYYINKSNGILIDVDNNEKQLVSAMDFMLDNYLKYKKFKLHKFIKEKFSYEPVSKEFLDIYKKVLNERR